MDTMLPSGLRSAPEIFTAVVDAMEWITRYEGVRVILHYLDDFLVMGAPGTDECAVARDTLVPIFGRLGLPVATEKLEGPDTSLSILDFQLDSVAMVVRLPQWKLKELKELIKLWQGRRS